MALQNNPLLTPSLLPYGAPELNKVKTEHFMPALIFSIEEAKKDIEAIKNNKDKPSFENTIEALEFSETGLSHVCAIFSNISSANSNDEMRKIENSFNVEVVKHSSAVAMDADLFSRVKAVYDNKAELKLSNEQAMLLEQSYKGFVRNGALLSNKNKKELSKIDERLSALSTEFNINMVESTKSYKKLIADEKILEGLPERAKNIYKQAAEDEGLKDKWLIKLSPPPMDIFDYAKDRNLRKEISDAFSKIADEDPYNNAPIVMEIVEMREKRAIALGYKTHSHFVLEDRMAKNPETVMSFLDENLKTYKPEAEKFLNEIKSYAKKTDGIDDIKPHDMSYYWRKLQEETFDLDLEELRPYFDIEKVLEGLQSHAEKLFNIKLTETTGKYPVYHPDVKVYEVHDKKTKDVIGIFYADYYARPGAKRGGAWMNTFRGHGLENDEHKIALVTNTCNFDKPTKDQPSLLSLREVETLFHEFGHGLHALLAKGDYTSITGTNVKWDFVELPSQLMENWVKEKEVLDTFAKHHKTGKALSPELIKKIKNMETFGSGYMGLRQTVFGLLDMKWHTSKHKDIGSAAKLEDSINDKYWLFSRDDGGLRSTSFGHLFAGGYSSAYYSYKWAEVLEADVFEEFKKKGLYDKKTAQRLRDTIYSKGGTQDPSELFRSMMGRDPDQKALFRREGISLANNDSKTKNSKINKPNI